MIFTDESPRRSTWPPRRDRCRHAPPAWRWPASSSTRRSTRCGARRPVLAHPRSSCTATRGRPTAPSWPRTGAKSSSGAGARPRLVQALRAFRVAVDFTCSTLQRDAPGGTGKTFPWSWPRSGGGTAADPLRRITPDNVAEAIAGVRPFAVDSASGPSPAPGVKDPAKVTALVPGRCSRSRWKRRERPPDRAAGSARTGAVRTRDADPGARRARARMGGGALRSGVPGRAGRVLRDYAGRPTPLYLAKRLSAEVGHDVWSSARTCSIRARTRSTTRWAVAPREADGQAPADRGDGRGASTAWAPRPRRAADMGVRGVHGTEDIRRSGPNVQRMKMLAPRCAGRLGARTLKEAVERGDPGLGGRLGLHLLRDRIGRGRAVPALVRDLQRVIGGRGARADALAGGRLPDRVIACVGGGSNANRHVRPVPGRPEVRIVVSRPGGRGSTPRRHGAPLATGAPRHPAWGAVGGPAGRAGQVVEAHSVSAGLDYPARGPSTRAARRGEGVVRAVTDDQAVGRVQAGRAARGDRAALESSHAVPGCWAIGMLVARSPDDLGRGDKDLAEVLGD